jgi:hypothetical protein
MALHNPPAFPNTFADEHNYVDGMTLRDYFAAKAMAAIITTDVSRDKDSIHIITAKAYFIADRMLDSR